MTIKIPKHVEIADWLREGIRSSTFKSGDKLIGENSLCEKFGISRHTARAALSKLEKEGLIVRKQGIGTYVNEDLYAGRKNIGVLLTYADDYTFSKMLSGIEDVLSKSSHLITIALTKNKVAAERSQLLSLLAANVDGLIVEATKSALATPNLDVYKGFSDRDIPIVFVNTYHTRLDCNYIVNDDLEGAALATGYLVEQGHRKIGGIFKHDAIQGGLRYEGFVNKLYEQNLNLDDNCIIWYSEESLDDLFSESQLPLLAERFSGCTAVLCYSDKAAYKLIEAAPKVGLSIPDGLSVVSFDNSYLAMAASPSLTTISHPGAEMGSLAAESILKLIDNPNRSIKHVYKPELIIRDSVKNICVEGGEL